MSIDNASVTGILTTTAPLHVSFVEWREGKGEVEYDDRPPLREATYDVLPYCPFFDQFLTKLTAVVPPITLAQAQKVKIDLVADVYNTKRQLPYHYPVAAGDYSWDASDDAMFSSTIPAIQNSTASINALAAALNSVVAHYNSNFVGIINQNAGIGNTLVGQINASVNARMSEINSWVVDPHNNSLNTYTPIGDSLVAYINDIILGVIGDALGGPNTINNTLQHTTNPESPPYGLRGAIAHTAISWANPYFATYVNNIGVAPGTFNVATAAPYTPLGPVTNVNALWIPFGGTAAVTVTPPEQAGIMNGIAARSNDLAVKRNTKAGQIKALTTVAQVIAYDVTTGW